MGTLTDLINNTKSAMTARIGSVLVLRKYGTAETSNDIETAVQGPGGGLLVESSADATVAALLAIPTLHTAITKSDATDLTTFANVGVIVGVAGNLAYRCVGAASTTVTLAVVAGQFVPGQFTRVMAATTATGVVGVAR